MNLKELLETAPDHILHHFSCDCAERALLRERSLGREPDTRSWKAIDVKRMWVEGNATDEELKEAKDAACDAYGETFWDASGPAARSAYCTAFWAAERTGTMDVEWSAYWAAYWVEAKDAAIAWQTEHLRSLIHQHKNTQINLLSALSERKACLSYLMDRKQKEMEDVLFYER